MKGWCVNARCTRCSGGTLSMQGHSCVRAVGVPLTASAIVVLSLVLQLCCHWLVWGGGGGGPGGC